MVVRAGSGRDARCGVGGLTNWKKLFIFLGVDSRSNPSYNFFPNPHVVSLTTISSILLQPLLSFPSSYLLPSFFLKIGAV